MKYDVVQQSLEEFVVANWPHTALQFDNVAFNSDLYDEFTRCTVVFGEGLQRSVTKGCYRQPGLLILSIYTKPATGTSRVLELATLAATMMTSVIVHSTPPLDAPKVNLKVPDLFKSVKEQSGWVFAQVSCPFYYDLEI